MILSGLVSALPKKAFDITVVSSNPNFTTRIHSGVQSVFPPPFGVKSFLHFRLLQTIRAIKKADIILFGGGGLFQDREPKAIFLWGWYRFVAGFFGKRIIFVGNSVGPLASHISKRIVQKSFQPSRFISVRDTASKNLLLDLGISHTCIVSATDAVFLLRKTPSAKRKKGTLLLLRGDGKITHQQIRKLLPLLPKPVSFLAMDTVDVSFGESLGLPRIQPKSPSDLRSLVSSAKLVLSSRLHGGILALQAETPFLLFSAAPKIQNFFAERSLKKLVLSETYSYKKAKTMITSLIKNASKWIKIFRKIRLLEQRKAKNILPEFLQK